MRVDLPNGQWAELKERKEIRQGQYNAYVRAWARADSVMASVALASRALKADGTEDKMLVKILDDDDAPVLDDEGNETFEEQTYVDNGRYLVAYGNLTDADFTKLEFKKAAAIEACVESWSFDLPIGLASVAELPEETCRDLGEKCIEHLKRVIPDTTPSGPEDGVTPTRPSAISGSDSNPVVGGSIPTSPTNTGSIDTGS